MDEISNAKILFVSPNGFMGGAERFIYNAAQGLAQQTKPYDASFLFYNDGPCKDLVAKNNPNTYLLPKKIKFRNPILVFKALVFTRRLIKQNQIDIVISNLPYAHILSSIASIGLNVKKIWFQHGPVGGLFDYLANLTPVDKILFNSKYLQIEHNKMPFAKRNLTKQAIIPLGNQNPPPRDENKIANITKTFCQEKDTLIILPGRITESKGQLLAIECFDQLINERNVKNIKLLIIGSSNSNEDHLYYEKLLAYCQKRKLGENIFFVPQQEDLSQYFYAADLLLHTTRIPEAFGLIVSEAMLAKCLVLGSSQGGVTEILKDKITGYTFDSTAENAKSLLVDRLLDILPEIKSLENEKIIQNAYEKIDQFYSISAMIQELDKIFYQCLKS